ncbi:MAG TPA: hypothetical protein VFO82_13330 [Steroidobacteraceae bacterium]|nr:hypothetical protein [Steroidobacteraceae bacterium]
MIGVSFRDEQRPAVEEFFELFKTPWEPFRPQGTYHTLLVAAGRPVPDVPARLVVIFGATPRAEDQRLDATPRATLPTTELTTDVGVLPLYGGAMGLEPGAPPAETLWGADGTFGLRRSSPGRHVWRLGYDLFDEVRILLGRGQPLEKAGMPSLDLHVELLRGWMRAAGASFIEIPAVPAGHRFAVALTHDIDFVGIRRHKFDHTMFGFLYRATAGGLLQFAKGRQSLRNTWRNLVAVFKLPFVWLGVARDFWMQFDAYRQIERGLAPTYFFIPFRGRAGQKVNAPHAARRAGPYDLAEVAGLIRELKAEGCEVGVHGIDSWHDAARGREELARVAEHKGDREIGIRMHWLLQDEGTPRVLEQAGYLYDSTSGYNDEVGYRAGTHQVFRPLDCTTLLEMPMHIQDGALFYAGKLALPESVAWQRCQSMTNNAETHGGVLTVLWHDRSLGPERHWGDFYVRLVADLRKRGAWFANARTVVDWFRARRAVRFTARGCELPGGAPRGLPGMLVREHRAGEAPREVRWDGAHEFQFQTTNPS